MTQHAPIDDEMTTTDEFEAVLGRLLSTAIENDIAVEGSWEYRSDGGDPDLEVVILELQKRGGDD